MATNVMTLEILEQRGACYVAKQWFEEKFPKKTAPMVKVFKAAIKEERTDWVAWYVRNTSSKKSAQALFKFTDLLVESTIIKIFEKQPEQQARYRKVLRRVRKGANPYDLEIPTYDGNEKESSVYILLREHYDAVRCKRDLAWQNVALNCFYTLRQVDSALGKKRFPSTNAGIDLFDTFPSVL